jgi:hypothetical protein
MFTITQFINEIGHKIFNIINKINNIENDISKINQRFDNEIIYTNIDNDFPPSFYINNNCKYMKEIKNANVFKKTQERIHEHFNHNYFLLLETFIYNDSVKQYLYNSNKDIYLVRYNKNNNEWEKWGVNNNTFYNGIPFCSRLSLNNIYNRILFIKNATISSKLIQNKRLTINEHKIDIKKSYFQLLEVHEKTHMNSISYNDIKFLNYDRYKFISIRIDIKFYIYDNKIYYLKIINDDTEVLLCHNMDNIPIIKYNILDLLESYIIISTDTSIENINIQLLLF